MTNIIYKLCIWALKRDFGTQCEGEEEYCYGCRAYEVRKFLEEVIELN
jgi:hypothetical protein